MYPTDPQKDKWLLTSEGHVFVERYRVYDQNMYCMDTFHNELELNHSFHLFICFEKPDKFNLKKSETNKISIRYAIFIFFNCRMYCSTTV